MEALKKAAAEMAVELVDDSMVVGLGTGSTVRYVIERLGEMKKGIIGVPTSIETERLAGRCGIELASVEDFDSIDIDIDGADEIDRELNLSKGLGGALYREKVVALMSRTLVIVADESKLVERLCERAPLSVEIMPFGYKRTVHELEALGCRCVLREQKSDNGDMLASCYPSSFTGSLEDLATRVKSVTGVVEHGLFLDMAAMAFIGRREGVLTLERQ